MLLLSLLAGSLPKWLDRHDAWRRQQQEWKEQQKQKQRQRRRSFWRRCLFDCLSVRVPLFECVCMCVLVCAKSAKKLSESWRTSKQVSKTTTSGGVCVCVQRWLEKHLKALTDNREYIHSKPQPQTQCWKGKPTQCPMPAQVGQPKKTEWQTDANCHSLKRK